MEIVKKFTPKIGGKFTYSDAVTFWNALSEPYKLQSQHHLQCVDKSNLVKSSESCKYETDLIKVMNEHKKIAGQFFNRTLNNKNLFPENEKAMLLKSINQSRLYKEAVGQYLEKYMKYKAKYLELKAKLNQV